MAVADPSGRAHRPAMPGTAPSPPQHDWPAQATDQIVNVVDQVRLKTLGPATRAARGAVFGLLAAVIGTASLILVFIGLVRAMTELFEWLFPWGGVWLTYLVLGLALLGSGALVFRRRHPPDGRPTA